MLYFFIILKLGGNYERTRQNQFYNATKEAY